MLVTSVWNIIKEGDVVIDSPMWQPKTHTHTLLIRFSTGLFFDNISTSHINLNTNILRLYRSSRLSIEWTLNNQSRIISIAIVLIMWFCDMWTLFVIGAVLEGSIWRWRHFGWWNYEVRHGNIVTPWQREPPDVTILYHNLYDVWKRKMTIMYVSIVGGFVKFVGL